MHRKGFLRNFSSVCAGAYLMAGPRPYQYPRRHDPEILAVLDLMLTWPVRSACLAPQS